MKSLSQQWIPTRRRVHPLDRAEHSRHHFLLIVRLVVKVFDECVRCRERRWVAAQRFELVLLLWSHAERNIGTSSC